ncbi:N-acetylmuramoyl-L-alanine amidase [Nocardia nova]|uniref:N-acetylmuramoyl-L-alanine amidase n=1 Tax=Nocardia nova TaxID=37330 RepID=UPI000686C2DB|nr:N-acetylmuramoyl-L-alanine amidase [Nocardia nova]
MLVPYRRPKRSVVLPVVATLAVAAPLATLTLHDSPGYRMADDSNLAAIPAELAEVALSSAPDVVLPLRELTGLNLPDLHLSDLRKLPLPKAIPVPPGLPAPPGVRLPSEIPLPQFGDRSDAPAPQPAHSGPGFIAAPLDPAQVPDGDPSEPALAPGAVPPDLSDQVGAEVKQLTRDTPFSMVALTADQLADTTSLIRAQQADGTWGAWYPTDQVDTNRDDRSPAPARTGTEPIYVGATKAVQVLTTHKVAAPAAGRSDDPAQAADQLSAVLIDPGRGAIDDKLSSVAAPLPGGGPKVISRAQWGADESLRCEEPTYDDGLGGITVHHTAGRNDYSKSESAGIVRAIYAYHAKTLGWCDIGYNALVDKYGQIFEGRYGGMDRPVEGAHAGGFNENTAGVAMMGDFESQPPTDAQLQATGQYVGWRAKVAGLDPEGHTTMYSEGTDFTPYAEGEAVQLPIVFAHRDVGNTTCPGDAAYARMDQIRQIAAGVTAGAPSEAKKQGPRTDLAALANLTSQLLGMVDKNIIAKYWAAQGGPNGRLGAVAAEPAPTHDGGQYAKFVNGYVYAAPDGAITELAGRILDRFEQLGSDTGLLGTPQRSTYPVPGGERADFQLGSLILNTATGVVTTLLKHSGPQQNPSADPIPAPLPDAAGPQAPSQPAAPAPGPVTPEAQGAPPVEGQVAPPPEPQAAPVPEAQAPGPEATAPAPEAQTPGPEAQAPGPDAQAAPPPESQAPAPDSQTAPAPEAQAPDPQPAPEAPAPEA